MDAAVFAAREADWRCGAIVYQVLVDRFAPPADPEARRALYPAPRRLRRWDEVPERGRYLAEHRLWSHELDFWGGDLPGLAQRLDHVQALGADVLYLNPIHLAATNHKYDALDHAQVAPEYGTRDDVKALAAELHRRGMRLVLDGVFNHMGRNAPAFRAAERDPADPRRDWFVFGPQFAGGARTWWNAENLPELNLENPAVRAHLWGDPDSVVRRWLRDGADGWRLDVAFDLGPAFLHELTQAAHAEKPGSLVVGEIANYPPAWFAAVDGVLMFTLRQLILRAASGRLDAAAAQRLVARLVADSGIEPLLRSWVYLDNHDTERLATALPDARARRLAQVLQFTLPGCPNLYYGSELGMEGGADPAMRAPMRWDLARAEPAPGSPQAWTQRLARLRRTHRALRVGGFRAAGAARLIAFERHTERAADAVVVLVNPAREPVVDTVLLPDSLLMDGTRFVDLLGDAGDPGDAAPLHLQAALLDVAMAPQSFRVLAPDTVPQGGGYSPYKRVA